jgi:hypothetical protein
VGNFGTHHFLEAGGAELGTLVVTPGEHGPEVGEAFLLRQGGRGEDDTRGQPFGCPGPQGVVAAEGAKEANGSEFATRRDDGARLGSEGFPEVVIRGGEEAQIVVGGGVGPLELEGGGEERGNSPGEGSVEVEEED